MSSLLSVFLGFFVVFSTAQQTLREAGSKNGIYMGAAINYHYLHSDSTYATIGGEQYSLLTAENGCKWSATEPEYNVFNFTQCDYVKNYGKSNNMTFRGHNLCWGEDNPSWLTNGGYNSDQLEQILDNHITTVMNHYGTEAYCWDVVNEAVSDSPSSGLYKHNVWYPAVPNYVQLAFQYARKAQPNVKLFYNDYNIIDSQGWMKDKSDAVYNLTKSLKEQGLIDGIGMQAHWSISSAFEPVDTDGITANFQRYQDLGLEIHITELDIECECNNNFNSNVDSEQGTMYEQLLEICLKFSNCKNFETWGYTDRYTWRGSNTYPLPFDYNYQPKDAVTDMLKALNS